MTNLAKRTPEVEKRLKECAAIKPSSLGVELVNIKIAEKRKEMRRQAAALGHSCLGSEE